jgi:hypothetical protein
VKDADRAKQLRERIEYVHGENRKLYEEMGRLGTVVDPQAVKDMRMELLIQVVLGDTTEVPRLEFEERFQTAVNQALQNTVKDAKRKSNLRKLHVPGQGGGKP